MRTQLSGVLWIHSMPGPLQPHITWALARLSMPDGTKPGRDIWRATDQDATLCAEVPFTASADTIATLVDNLARWPRLYFELAQDPAVDDGGYAIDGMRYFHTPQLGTFAGQTDAAGNIVVNEDALRSIMARGGDIEGVLDAAIGGPWDRVLEPMRMMTAGYAPEECFTTSTPVGPDSASGNSTAGNAELGGVEAANVLQLYPRRAAM